MKTRVLLTISLFAFFFASAQQNMDTVTIRPTKVKDNIYMLKGSGGNIGLLAGTDGSLIIDDQFAPLSMKITEAVGKLTSNPIKYLVNTHVHGDHTGGNENFKKMGATIIAQENVRSRMMKEFVDRQGKTQPPRDKAAWPLVTFDDRIRLHLNGEDVELIYVKVNAHTDGDVVVRFVNANVYHVGDLFRNGFPFIDITNGGSFKGLITALDKVIEVTDDKSIIIPGHGELSNKADVKSFRDKMKDISDKVTAAIKKGTKPEDIAGLGITNPYEETMGKGFVKGKDLVMLIAAEYAKK